MGKFLFNLLIVSLLSCGQLSAETFWPDEKGTFGKVKYYLDAAKPVMNTFRARAIAYLTGKLARQYPDAPELHLYFMASYRGNPTKFQGIGYGSMKECSCKEASYHFGTKDALYIVIYGNRFSAKETLRLAKFALTNVQHIRETQKVRIVQRQGLYNRFNIVPDSMIFSILTGFDKADPQIQEILNLKVFEGLGAPDPDCRGMFIRELYSVFEGLDCPDLDRFRELMRRETNHPDTTVFTDQGREYNYYFRNDSFFVYQYFTSYGKRDTMLFGMSNIHQIIGARGLLVFDSDSSFYYIDHNRSFSTRPKEYPLRYVIPGTAEMTDTGIFLHDSESPGAALILSFYEGMLEKRKKVLFHGPSGRIIPDFEERELQLINEVLSK